MDKKEMQDLQLPPLDDIISSAFDKAEEAAQAEERKVKIDSRFRYSLCVIKAEEDGQGLIQIENEGNNVVCKHFGYSYDRNPTTWCKLTGEPCYHSAKWEPIRIPE